MDNTQTNEKKASKSNENAVTNTDKKAKNRKKSSAIKVFLTIFLVILIICISMASVFAYLIHINYYGIADKYEKSLENIPLVKLILPPPYDPEAPYHMPFHILASKYNQLREENSKLNLEVETLKNEVDELSYYKDNADSIMSENARLRTELMAGLDEYNSKMKKYEQIKSELDRSIANVNIEEFRNYYESIDAENARDIYESIVNQDVADSRLREFAAIYENMDASTAAAILEKMGTSRMNLIVDILFNMKKERSSAIISAMRQDFAAKVMNQLSARYR